MTNAERRTQLEAYIRRAEAEAYGLEIQREYVSVQGVDAEGRKQAAESANALKVQQQNAERGIARLKEMLAELPEEDVEEG